MTVQADRAQPTEPAPRRPNLDGDLDALLDDSGPDFRTALRGYDRVQVDNYVAWAENELAAARRAGAELAARVASYGAELQVLRRRPAMSEEAEEYTRLSERVSEMLRLATEEASAIRAAAVAEAEEITGQARADADLVLRRAQKLEADAAARREEAERAVAAVAETAEQRAAEAERTAAARVAQAEERVAELHRRATELRAVLDGLAGRVDGVLEALAVGTVEPPAAAPEPEVVHQSRPMVVHRAPVGAPPAERTQVLPAVPTAGRRPEAEAV